MPKSQPNGEFIHSGSCPHAIAILDAVTHGRDVPGIVADPPGISVDWHEAAGSWLSTTETLAVRLARVVAGMERHGGSFPPHVAEAVAVACAELTGTGAAAPAGPLVVAVVPDTDGLLRAGLDALAQALHLVASDDPSFGPWATAAARVAGPLVAAEAEAAPTLLNPAGIDVVGLRLVKVHAGDIAAAVSAAAALRNHLGDDQVDWAVDWAAADHPGIGPARAPSGLDDCDDRYGERRTTVDQMGRCVTLLAALTHSPDTDVLAGCTASTGPHQLTAAQWAALVRLVRLVVAVLHPDAPGIAAYGYLGR